MPFRCLVVLQRHGLDGRLQGGRIPRIGLQMIKIPQVPTRAIEQETKELLEEGPEGQPLAAFAE